jgi:hypothetical protein
MQRYFNLNGGGIFGQCMGSVPTLDDFGWLLIYSGNSGLESHNGRGLDVFTTTLYSQDDYSTQSEDK